MNRDPAILDAMSTEQLPSFAQHGEDVLVWDYFEHKRDGFFIEVGANHPTELSQTWFLEQRGWRGLLIEPLPQCCDRLRAARPGSIVCQTAAGAPDQVGEATLHVAASDAWSKLGGEPDDAAASVAAIRVPVRTLDQLCEEHRVTAIDFLSIDVEGMEIQVLQGFDLARRRPALIVLEDYLDTLALYFFMRRAGYRLAKRTGCNNWWIPAGARPLPQSLREKLSLWNRILFRRTFCKLRALVAAGE